MLPLPGYKRWGIGWSEQHGPAYTTRYSWTQAGKRPITANTYKMDAEVNGIEEN